MYFLPNIYLNIQEDSVQLWEFSFLFSKILGILFLGIGVLILYTKPNQPKSKPHLPVNPSGAGPEKNPNPKENFIFKLMRWLIVGNKIKSDISRFKVNDNKIDKVFEIPEGSDTETYRKIFTEFILSSELWKDQK